MFERKVDVAILGAGSAGLAAYRAAKKHTASVVLIEGGPYGTTCARVGCMPSKLLIAAAEAAHDAEKAPSFGVETGPVHIDGEAVMARVRGERDRFVGFVLDSVEAIPESDKILGHARFLDNHRLAVDSGLVVNAKRIVIATGSSPAVPDSFAGLGDRLIVNDDIFDWRHLPKTVAVFGPGVIGLELGQALSRLGVEVLMFGIGGLLGPLTDPAVRAESQAAFADEFAIDTDARIRLIRRTPTGVLIEHVVDNGTARQVDVDYVIAATGRRPNIGGLDLANTSLVLDRSGVPVADARTLQVGESHVFIAGDATNDKPVLHEASDEGRIAGDNAGRFPDVVPGHRRTPLAIVFSDPQIAMVGASYAALSDRDIVIGEVSFENQGRSRVMLRNRGLLRIYADAENGTFLGAEMAGPRAEHIAHLLAWAHQSRLTIAEMLDMPFYHPVIEEGLRTALRDALDQLSTARERAA